MDLSGGYTRDNERGSGGRSLNPRKDDKGQGSLGKEGAGSPSSPLTRRPSGTTSSPHASSPARSGAAGAGSKKPAQPASSSLIGFGMLRNTGRVGSLGRNSSNNSSGVAAALGATLSFGTGGGMRTKSSNPPVEHELSLGDAVLGYGSASFQGMRDYQEDAVAFLQTATTLAGAVYDGHGGDDVSKELERVLLQSIHKGITDLTGKDGQPVGGDPSPTQISDAIASAYQVTNSEMCQRLDAAMEAGSCAVTMVITKAAGGLWLFCAKAGDCRAVLFTGPSNSRRAVRLSEDHKPQPHVCPAEIARVCDAGGCVLWGRVQGCLAVSRAFGDKTLQPYVIADPYITARPLNVDQDAFLYLASDGVTDLIDDTQACQIINEQFARGSNAGQAAAALVSAAYQQGSSDNISAVVVRIRKSDRNVRSG